MFKLSVLVVLVIQVTATPIQPGVGIFGNKFQGDIKLTKEQEDALKGGSEGAAPNTGWTHESFRWPKNAQGQVIMPYTINPSAGFCK